MERCTQPRSLPFGFFSPRAASTDEEEEAEEGGARSKVQAFLETECSGDLEALRRGPPAPAPLLTCLASSLLLLVLVGEFGSALDEEGKGAAAVAAGVRDTNKHTALHFAAREGRTEVCQFLVEQLRLPVDPKDDWLLSSVEPCGYCIASYRTCSLISYKVQFLKTGSNTITSCNLRDNVSIETGVLQIALKYLEEGIRVDALSTMILIVRTTDSNGEREKFGFISAMESLH
ncbi:hypothetical protein ZWY2020_028053 [Hordeum vulgare]|nr:hypothetical protein ZWY2020_028053 [Hordeum vulgare]